jgi:hypothetical protein
MSGARWAVRLASGHQQHYTPPAMPPRPGQWVSCHTPGCRRQEQVTAVLQVHEPAAWVQDELFHRDEAAA